MENIESKYIIWNHPKRLIVCDNLPDDGIHPFYEDAIENATIVFNDNGTIILKGDMWQWGFCSYDEYPKYMDYEVHPECVTKTRFRKKDVVRAGWHRKKQNIYKEIIIKDFIIEKDGKMY